MEKVANIVWDSLGICSLRKEDEINLKQTPKHVLKKTLWNSLFPITLWSCWIIDIKDIPPSSFLGSSQIEIRKYAMKKGNSELSKWYFFPMGKDQF